jgi:nicotinamide-nucleotide amidase
MFPDPIDRLARQVLIAARDRGLTLGTAESCTGGLLAAALCAVPGASDVFDRGFVTYSNAAKLEALGVPEATLEAHGAVSDPTARAMALGVLAHSRAALAASTTGIAGPGGGTDEKPVGLVHLAVAMRGGAVIHRRELFGPLPREAIQMATVRSALFMLLEALS